jgi:hypothetical protein
MKAASLHRDPGRCWWGRQWALGNLLENGRHGSRHPLFRWGNVPSGAQFGEVGSLFFRGLRRDGLRTEPWVEAGHPLALDRRNRIRSFGRHKSGKR